jgi:hypothetical protein
MMWNKLKSVLLDVFSDDSTLSTPMGAWFDALVHHDSECWMNVRERNINQQTNGEWSQYAYHTFSQLRFSTKPMPVPHRGQLSQTIQATQRTEYLEVTATFYIVTSQDTVPTALHSYTSDKGLSFLALHRHIQRPTGDIPALPTPLKFDLDEDGSLLFGVGYHG